MNLGFLERPDLASFRPFERVGPGAGSTLVCGERWMNLYLGLKICIPLRRRRAVGVLRLPSLTPSPLSPAGEGFVCLNPPSSPALPLSSLHRRRCFLFLFFLLFIVCAVDL